MKGPGPCRTWSHFGDVQLDGLNWAAVARFEGNIADDLSRWGAEIPVATYGTATTDEADAFGFRWQRSGLSSKHMRFDWSGPDA